MIYRYLCIFLLDSIPVEPYHIYKIRIQFQAILGAYYISIVYYKDWMTHLSCTSEIVQRKSELRYLFTELVTTSTCLFLDLNWYENLNGKHWMFYLSDTITIKFLRINIHKNPLCHRMHYGN